VLTLVAAQAAPVDLLTPESDDHAVATVVPSPVGTPGAPLTKAFGPDRRLLVKASVESAALTVATIDEYRDWRVLTERMTWRWNVRTDSIQTHTPTIYLLIQPEPSGWEPGAPLGAEATELYSGLLRVEVERNIFSFAAISIGDVLIALIGPVLVPIGRKALAWVNRRSRRATILPHPRRSRGG
jgi:hypothetical protein